MKEIEITVEGHPATIVSLLPGRHFSYDRPDLVAIVEFKDHVAGLISKGIRLEARDYTREEFIRIVTKRATEAVVHHRAEQARVRDWHSQEEKHKEFTRQVADRVVIDTLGNEG